MEHLDRLHLSLEWRNFPSTALDPPRLSGAELHLGTLAIYYYAVIHQPTTARPSHE